MSSWLPYSRRQRRFITGYEVENEGDLITTTYSNGTVIKVDFADRSIDFNGQYYNLSKLEEEGGVRF